MNKNQLTKMLKVNKIAEEELGMNDFEIQEEDCLETLILKNSGIREEVKMSWGIAPYRESTLYIDLWYFENNEDGRNWLKKYIKFLDRISKLDFNIAIQFLDMYDNLYSLSEAKTELNLILEDFES